MNCEIISVGTELLLGEILNTNAKFLSLELAKVGVSVYYQTTVGDNEKRLFDALSVAFNRSDIVILTGGLGPTEDDLTKETVAKYFGLKLVPHIPSQNRIKSHFEKTGSKMAQSNMKQADMPEGCIILQNNNGTAPGGIVEKNGKTAIFLPGPPNEMQAMYAESVEPYLKGKSDVYLFSREIKTFGVGESLLEEKIKHIIKKYDTPTIAPYAKLAEVMIRLTTTAKSQDEADKIFDKVEAEIDECIPDAIYGYSSDELQDAVYKLLKKTSLKVATAESCTGGLLGGALTSVPGISEFYEMGEITYSNDAKMQLLGVSKDVLDKFGAVSEENAREMAKGIVKKSGADIGVAITGIAGPDGGTDEKPVGLVYVALADNCGYSEVKKLNLNGNRERVRTVTVKNALNMIRMYVIKK